MQFADVPAIAVESPVFDRFCPAIDGVLGTSGLARNLGFLDRVTIEIDRDRGRLLLFRQGAPRSTADTILPLRSYYVSELGEKIPESTTIPVVLGGVLFWAALDTGAAGLSEMTLDDFLKSGGSLEDEVVHEFVGPDSISAGGMSSSARSWIVRLGHFSLGAIRFRSVPFRIVEHGREAGSVRLAQNVIRQFNLTLDYPRDQLLLTKRSSFESDPAIPTQLVWDVRDGHIIVVGLLKNGVAETAGIKIGDEVLAFDGHETRADAASMRCAMMEFDVNSGPVRLRLRRGDQEFEVTLPSEEDF
jgi:hypothetical protein